MFIRSASEINAIDVLTHDSSLVVKDVKDSWGLAFDIKDKKVYFGDEDGSLSKANFDGSDRKVILKNAKVYKMAIDWVGRRIFWTKTTRSMHRIGMNVDGLMIERALQVSQKRIFVVNMDGKHERMLKSLQEEPYGIAVDPNVG